MKLNRSALTLQRRQRLALFFGIGTLSWLLYTAVRSQILLANGRAIGAHSATFARDTFVGEAGAPAFTYLAMGDSTGAGWGAATLQATYPYLVAQAVAQRGFRVHIVNVAKGGATARDVAVNQLPSIAEVKPDLITLSVGANDTTHGTAPEDYRRDLNAILAALETSSARQILAADTPDMFLAPALPLPLSWVTARRARAQNAVLRELTRDSRVQIVELYEKGKLDESELYAADRFHPSSAGYARWARLFIERL